MEIRGEMEMLSALCDARTLCAPKVEACFGSYRATSWHGATRSRLVGHPAATGLDADPGAPAMWAGATRLIEPGGRVPACSASYAAGRSSTR